MRSKTHQSVAFEGENGTRLLVLAGSLGEPFRQGVNMQLIEGYNNLSEVFLEDREAVLLRDMLNRLYPIGGAS